MFCVRNKQKRSAKRGDVIIYDLEKKYFTVINKEFEIPEIYFTPDETRQPCPLQGNEEAIRIQVHCIAKIYAAAAAIPCEIMELKNYAKNSIAYLIS
jgi:hypothetical protein